MRKFLFLTILLVQYSFSQSQYEKNAQCIRTKNLSEKERLTHFPFSKAAQIKIISFKDKSDGTLGHDLMNYMNSIVIGKDTLASNLYDEITNLTPQQINQLTDIIFNYSHKKEPYAIAQAGCYMPRNAIFFLDDNNTIIAWLELCFGCDNYRTSDKKLTIGEYCDQKYDMLKSIFKEAKIQYGITITE
ncbi:hypothetical protein [Flavobacterium pectinovorum]|uniref:GLPGLI family protein n=1 Tax=Flavobacterium pectinovorum TaxID=29533 RepID=A0AB36P0Z5_9FLAO|nr:hypothetical protein [Flavobacterium pectinovorum]OXB04428.1 hypothetical protein B0A72_13110 [Flavobacterium pectinovorum]SHL58018.1 hypothetical protein SAMN05444387_0974 [Flavobacterium pectinovorum]